MLSRRSALATLAGSALAFGTSRVFSADAPAGRIRVGQIGTAHSHATGKMESVRGMPEIYEVIGVAEEHEARRAAAAKSKAFDGLAFRGERELLETPGLRAVIVETTLADSTATALRAIRAGKHVHLDKPGGADHAAFKAMREEAEQKKLTVQMGYMLRYNPAFELLFAAVRTGWLGEITEIDAAMGKLADDRQRAILRDHPGHGMFELACHVIDVVVKVLGKPAAVHSFGKATRAPGDAMPDNQLAVLEYPKATATVRCNHADPFGGPRRRFAVAGTKGAMEIEPLESGKATLHLHEAHGDFLKGANKLELKVPPGRYDGEFRDLARVIRGEYALGWDAAHDVAVHETVMRAAGVWRSGGEK
jgi:predicted dehydrogenase